VLPASDDGLIRVTTAPSSALLPYVETARMPRTRARAVFAVASDDGEDEDEEDYKGWQFFSGKWHWGGSRAPPYSAALVILQRAQRLTGRALALYETRPEYLARAERPAAPPVQHVPPAPPPQAPAVPLAQVALLQPASSALSNIPAPSQTQAALRAPPAGSRAGGNSPAPGGVVDPPRTAESARAAVAPAQGSGGTSDALLPAPPRDDHSAVTGTQVVADQPPTPDPVFVPWPSRFPPADLAAAADRPAQMTSQSPRVSADSTRHTPPSQRLARHCWPSDSAGRSRCTRSARAGARRVLWLGARGGSGGA
jgi:hypothetical protein